MAGWISLFALTHIVGDTGVDEVSDKLHDAAVGVSVVQWGGSDGALDDVDDDAAAEQSDRTPLDKPGQTVEVRGHSGIRPLQICEPADSPGGQSEQVVHSVGMIPQTILLLQQLEGWHAQSLKEDGGLHHHHHHQPHTGMKILLWKFTLQSVHCERTVIQS